LNVYHGDAELRRNVLLAPAPFPEGKFSFEADGNAEGAAAGIRWQLQPKYVFGAVTRTRRCSWRPACEVLKAPFLPLNRRFKRDQPAI
jgi:hypothetical protein